MQYYYAQYVVRGRKRRIESFIWFLLGVVVVTSSSSLLRIWHKWYHFSCRTAPNTTLHNDNRCASYSRPLAFVPAPTFAINVLFSFDDSCARGDYCAVLTRYYNEHNNTKIYIHEATHLSVYVYSIRTSIDCGACTRFCKQMRCARATHLPPHTGTNS